jgi:predicted permease
VSNLNRFQRYLGSLLGKVNVAEEVKQELAFHVEMRTRELIARGMDAEEARAAAVARFGDLTAVGRLCRKIAQGRDRSMSRYVWFEQLRQDLVFATRQIRKNKALTVVVTLTLAIAIAANTIVFSVNNTVLLRPLPFPEPERLVRIQEATPEGEMFSVSAPTYIDFREQSRSFTDIAAISGPPMSFALLGHGEPELCIGIPTTGSLFAVLGLEPVLGRSFTPAEEQPGSESRVVIISNGLWQSRFDADPGIIGTTIDMDGEGWTVVGVLPAGFDFLINPDVWVPLEADPAASRSAHRIELFARIKDGISLQQARADLDAVAAHISDTYPESNQGWGVIVRSFSEWLIPERARQATMVLTAAVALMLLLACANVSNLLIVRVANRYQEIGTRFALGASRARVMRQLLSESLLLALLGAACGLLISMGAVAAIRNLAADALPRLDELVIDTRVLLFTLAVTVIAGALSGVAPALQITGGRLAAALGSIRQGAMPGPRRFHDAMVVAELSLALMLAIGAGLLVRSFTELHQVDPGFFPEQVVTAELTLPVSRYPELQPQTASFFRELVVGIEAIPGVSAVGATQVNPFRGPRPANKVGDETALDQAEFVRCQYRIVTPGFFEAMSIPLLRGRSFDTSDSEQSDLVVAISADLAERLWPGSDAVGKRLRWSTPDGFLATVVGVVPGIRDISLDTPPLPMIFLNHEQVAWPAMTLVIKTFGEPSQIASAIREAVWRVDKNLPAPELGLLGSNLSGEVAGPRLNTQLLGIFALLALLIAVMGVYGVISYRVTRRRRELGIRIALGARSRDLFSMVLRQGLLLVMLGASLGIIGSLLLTRFLESVLYGISATNPGTFVTVALLFVVVATLACYLPARRTARVNPATVLRAE